MMSNVYEVVKKTDEGFRSIGYFQSERRANAEAKSHNDWCIRNSMRTASKLTGTVRGVNADRYRELENEACNPPYSVKIHRLNRGF